MDATPTLTVLMQREVDALYDLLSAVDAALRQLDITYIVIAGTLLGAVRSQSILFCDDDVDIAVLSVADYQRVVKELPPLLAPVASYKRRPWPAADKVRPKALPHVWIDVFLLRRYDSLTDLLDMCRFKDNGERQPRSYVVRILAPVLALCGADAAELASDSCDELPAATVDAWAAALAARSVFPLWHYDTRKGLELWPKEFFLAHELFPVQPASLTFGHLPLPGPADPVPHLRRAFGAACFREYPRHVDHSAWAKEFRGRQEPQENADAAADAAMAPLLPVHYVPVQHSDPAKRVHSSHDQAALAALLAAQGYEL